MTRFMKRQTGSGAKGNDGLTHWVTDQLALGPAPMSYSRLDALKETGIGAILNLSAEFPDLPDIQRAQGFDVFYLPVVDEGVPEPELLDEALAWLDEVLYLGKKAYIHCRHGIGRTGTVLNAYLLRKGLGHKQAGKTLKKLRSKPESFDQWWFIRKYGRKAGKLSIRQPRLESQRKVDLAPFIQDYGDLVVMTESRVTAEPKGLARCGAEHVDCCHSVFSVTLIEALLVATEIDLELTSEERLKVMERAADFDRLGWNASGPDGKGGSSGANGHAYAGGDCPLLKAGKCLLFDSRPLVCRTFDLGPDMRTGLWEETLNPGLEEISRQVYFAYFSSFPLDVLPRYALSEVISGRYVQTFFDWMRRMSRNGR